MPATAQSAAVDLPLPAVQDAAPRPAPKPRRRAPSEGMWVYPFAITLAGSLAVFLWQMGEYTTLLG
jgi:hypothetical protein